MASTDSEGALPVRVERSPGVGRIVLDRTDVYNAMDERVIRLVTEAARGLNEDPDVRVVVLESRGKLFCAGADIEYMRRAGGFSREENVADSKRLAAMFGSLYALRKPLIARVHGATFGGGVGLVATADLVIIGPRASFTLSEVRLGIIPAVIGPYVARRVGAARAAGLFATAVKVRARDAVHMGLADMLCDSVEDLDARVDEAVKAALEAGPEAAARALSLADEIIGKDPEGLIDAMAELSADFRASDEGREGLSAFLERRKAAWVIDPSEA